MNYPSLVCHAKLKKGLQLLRICSRVFASFQNINTLSAVLLLNDVIFSKCSVVPEFIVSNFILYCLVNACWWVIKWRFVYKLRTEASMYIKQKAYGYIFQEYGQWPRGFTVNPRALNYDCPPMKNPIIFTARSVRHAWFGFGLDRLLCLVEKVS